MRTTRLRVQTVNPVLPDSTTHTAAGTAIREHRPLCLEHADEDCPSAFRAYRPSGVGTRPEAIVCDGCGARYPADTRALLALAFNHLVASRLILAALPGRIELLRERQRAAGPPLCLTTA